MFSASLQMEPAIPASSLLLFQVMPISRGQKGTSGADFLGLSERRLAMHRETQNPNARKQVVQVRSLYSNMQRCFNERERREAKLIQTALWGKNQFNSSGLRLH